MRAGKTYRYARREAAKLVAKAEGFSFADFWQVRGDRYFAKKAKRLRAGWYGGTSRYLPHQGEREVARRLRQANDTSPTRFERKIARLYL